MDRKYQGQNLPVDLATIGGIADRMWRRMPPETQRIYEEQAKRLGDNYSKERIMHQAVLIEVQKLMDLTRLPAPADINAPQFSGLGVKRPPETSLEGICDQKQQCLSQPPRLLSRFDQEHSLQWAPIGNQRNSAFSHFNPLRIKEEECGAAGKQQVQGLMAGPSTENPVPAGAVQKIPIVCNGISGTFLLGLQRVICSCASCAATPEASWEFTATQFEQHCGAGSAKKWKASLRIRPGSVPEVPLGGAPLSLGRWFDMKGIDTKSTRSVPKVRSHPPPSSEAKAPEKPGGGKKTAKGKMRIDKKQDDAEPWRQVERGGYSMIKVNYAGDRCTACDSDVDYDCDQLITCDGCGMCVHQTCYGIPEAPKSDQIWLCAACEARMRGEPPPRCCLCPIEGGAMKPTDIPGLWAHVACMQWIPEVTVRDPTKMEPIERITHIQKERWELSCSLCKQRMGAKIQCLQCYSTYHPLCARMAGLHMEMQEGRGGPAGPWRLVTYCPRHCKPRPELSGVHQVKQSTNSAGSHLFNRQPFVQPPAVKLPVCSSGAARTQPLTDWVRASHGTGAGFSSAKAFWIPEAPSQVCQVLRSREGEGEHFENPQKLQSVAAACRVSSKSDKRPVELLPLPDGVPETITVECNGRRGMLVVRSQRVLCSDEETTASRFEQLCGKGEAKKWKCSLWYVGSNGEASMQMQDWLNLMGLDRKVLSSLQANLAAYNLYHQYLDLQVEEVTREMINSVEAGVAASPDDKGDCAPIDLSSDPDCSSLRMDLSTVHSSDTSPSDNFDGEETNLRASNGEGPEQGYGCPSESLSQELMDEDAVHASDLSTEACSDQKVYGCLQSSAAVQRSGGCNGNSTREGNSSTLGHKDVLQDNSGIQQFEDPAACINRVCHIHWPDDHKWYSAVIKEHRPGTTVFRILYDVDQQEEWLDLQCEADEGRLEWEIDKGMHRSVMFYSGKGARAATGSNSKPRGTRNGNLFPKLYRPVEENAAENSYQPKGDDAIGVRLSIWWADDSMFYPGVVISWDKESGKHHIHYDDGDEEWLDVSKEHVVWDSTNWEPPENDINSAGADAEVPGDESHHSVDPQEITVSKCPPQTIQIVCNRMEAEYKLDRTVVVLKDGSEMTPTEFERVAGKGASKKWKASIRVVNSKGNPGISLGEWMINQGLDTPKLRVSKCIEKEPRRLPKRHASSIDRKKPRHRQCCMCIICKQARRKGDPAPNAENHHITSEGAGASRGAAIAPQSWRPATTTAAARAVGPRIRSGKRSYVEACPQLIRGASTHSPLDIPESRSWTPENFSGDRRIRQRIDQSGDLAQPLCSRQGGPSDGGRGCLQDEKPILTKLESWRKQLKECQATEKERILFGKSGIHGWGLFARKRLKKDAMVIEYRGEVVGPAVADVREKMYKEQGKDCYLFHINEDHVIDATVNGAIGRFTNHSCAPSMYTKILFVDGKYHLCFFSRYDILPGQELTYDYRFKEETAENKIDCQCGAPNCRGSMN